MGVPRLWPGATVAIFATGPSLTAEDIAICQGRVPAVAIKDAHRLAPWVDVLYACDAKWWNQYEGVPAFAGLKFSLDPQSARWPGVEVLANTGEEGIELDPSGLRTGRNSGYQAINLTVHFGARRIVLLGYDMKPNTHGRNHFFGQHPWNTTPPFHLFLESFPAIVEPLKQIGIEVINCTRESVLDSFPRMRLEEALALEATCSL